MDNFWFTGAQEHRRGLPGPSGPGAECSLLMAEAPDSRPRMKHCGPIDSSLSDASWLCSTGIADAVNEQRLYRVRCMGEVVDCGYPYPLVANPQLRPCVPAGALCDGVTTYEGFSASITGVTCCLRYPIPVVSVLLPGSLSALLLRAPWATALPPSGGWGGRPSDQTVLPAVGDLVPEPLPMRDVTVAVEALFCCPAQLLLREAHRAPTAVVPC